MLGVSGVVGVFGVLGVLLAHLGLLFFVVGHACSGRVVGGVLN